MHDPHDSLESNPDNNPDNNPDTTDFSTPPDPSPEMSNWVDEALSNPVNSSATANKVTFGDRISRLSPEQLTTLATVETAFLASTASLLWLIDYYFPTGPVLRVFFPLPIALVYLRWGARSAWMAALVSALLLSVLMGPTRGIFYTIPFGVMGVQLGALWQRGASWGWSILFGALISAFGFFFRFWLLSLMMGEDLLSLVIAQITEVLQWLFLRFGWWQVPEVWMVQSFALVSIVFNSFVYVFVVHIVSMVTLDRLKIAIPRPPKWVRVLLDYD